MAKDKDKPDGLDQAWLDDLVVRIKTLSRQLATGQPTSHAQFRALWGASHALQQGLVQAGHVGSDE